MATLRVVVQESGSNSGSGSDSGEQTLSLSLETAKNSARALFDAVAALAPEPKAVKSRTQVDVELRCENLKPLAPGAAIGACATYVYHSDEPYRSKEELLGRVDLKRCEVVLNLVAIAREDGCVQTLAACALACLALLLTHRRAAAPRAQLRLLHDAGGQRAAGACAEQRSALQGGAGQC